MSKSSKNISNSEKTKEKQGNQKSVRTSNAKFNDKSSSASDYLFSMRSAPRIGTNTHWFQMIPAAFFTAVVVMIVRMASYQRPMNQFFWSGGTSELTDFFSYDKMIAILICTILALTILLYRFVTQSFYIKRSYAYVPMIVYTVFTGLSYLLSDYKEFALLGWNDRFEGTLTLFGYMIMLFYIINSVNTEKNVKWVIYPLAATSALLGLLGLSQALDKDFFRTTIGQKMITPNFTSESGKTIWQLIDSAAAKGEQFFQFTFNNREIYQTVYNINYVSFYLTLLIPLFGMLFIKSVMMGKEEPIWKKITWGALFTLLVFNLIGSSSSGGLMGMAVVVLMALIVLNKKIIKWIKPVIILAVITVLVAGASYQRWMPELTGAINGVLGTQTQQADTSKKMLCKVDYMETSGDAIISGINGNKLVLNTFIDNPASLAEATDSEGNLLRLIQTDDSTTYKIDDSRFDGLTLSPAQDDEGNYYVILKTNGDDWQFLISKNGVKYRTGLGTTIDLHKVPAVGWENNQGFGSGRGYIWSRTIPMMKDTMIIGHGADTYCAYFPHEDYVGKYNSGTFTSVRDIIVDKPHNMYMGIIIGTGGISMLALLALWGMYIVQSFILYRKNIYDSFLAYSGAGIFLGVSGFLVSALVNDSTVSVTPIFYGLLGTGIAINIMLKRQLPKAPAKADAKQINE